MIDPTALNVSLTFIALCASTLLPFSAWIGTLRGRLGILRGDGGNPILHKRVRIHGNFIENAPLTALVMVAAEALGAADAWLWAAVACFTAGRVLHFIRYDAKDRGVGMFMTTLPPFLLGSYVLLRIYGLL